MNQGISEVTQPQLAAVLRYFAHGDFLRFRKAAESVLGADSIKEPYFCANLLFAFQMAGLCDVRSEKGGTTWWASHSGDIRLNSMSSKEIGATPQWFTRHAKCLVPLITDWNMSSLVLGSLNGGPTADATSSVFDRAFVNLVPAFADVEEQVCVEVPFSDDSLGSVEVFEPSSGVWTESTSRCLSASHLIRTRKDYSGLVYYVQHSALALRFKITEPEWAFVVAYHILPWKLSDVVKIRDDAVSITRTVRLPVLLYRTLFAAARAVRIGPVVTFEGVDARCIDGVLAYFRAVGERQ